MMRLLQIPMLCLLASISLIAEDLAITWKSKQSGAFGSDTNTWTEYHSSQYTFLKSNYGSDDYLMDFADSVIYYIDYRERTIKKYALEDAKKYYDALAKAKVDAPDKYEKLDETMKNFVSIGPVFDTIMKDLIGDGDKPTIKKIGTEKVLKRKCDKLGISLGNINLEVCYDPTLILPHPINIEMQKMLANALKKATLRCSEELHKLNISGATLKFRGTMLFGGTHTVKVEKTATKIAQGPISASVFELPKGYEITDEGKKKLEALEAALAD
jgi:hypothetical protein